MGKATQRGRLSSQEVEGHLKESSLQRKWAWPLDSTCIQSFTVEATFCPRQNTNVWDTSICMNWAQPKMSWLLYVSTSLDKRTSHILLVQKMIWTGWDETHPGSDGRSCKQARRMLEALCELLQDWHVYAYHTFCRQMKKRWRRP